MKSRKKVSIQYPDSSIGVTEFKSHCLSLIDDVAKGKRTRVLLMKHNKPVAVIIPIEEPNIELWGALRGTVQVAPDIDLTDPVGESWDAEA